ncbi:GAF domain-containing protein [Uliginosibacterium sp. H1]|uniref:GAF domain-containing protein n=1 Tax=Uliginosibacterium sp. H1 TaxID=3114757 RepID=UPI002E180629|nr:GAF domain-containing protein [Uliginosibacterium sp. H1]
MKPSVDALRGVLDGSIPPIIATVSRDGVPNVSYVSQVEYVDAGHVALSFQFFNKTRENILAHPYATAYLTDSDSAASYRLSIEYLRTETAGQVFERMKAKLAGIASHTGMAGVFRLQGADIYKVLAIESVPGDTVAPPPPRRNALGALRTASARMARAGDLAQLLDETLAALHEDFDMPHGMVLLREDAGKRLYIVASRGYPQSGVGSEIPFGGGVIGTAAEYRTPIRIGYMTNEYAYGMAMRASALEAGLPSVQDEIPFPGLPMPPSQMAVPILAGGELLGVLYVDSHEMCRYGHAEEDALVVLANQLGGGLRAFQQAADAVEEAAEPVAPLHAAGDRRPLRLRRYTENDSVFVDDDYLIKGVAGAIFWKLASDYTRHGRTDFSNRELRLDPAIRLPDIDDNLEARLILLSRRLRERCDAIAIEKTGRGRFRLCVAQPLELQEN